MTISKTMKQHWVYETFWTEEKREENGVLDFGSENG